MLKQLPPWLKYGFVLLLGLLALGGGFWVFSTPGLKPVVIHMYEPAILTPDEVTHHLGTIPMDSKVHHTFALYNTGGKKLTIQDVEASCGCTATDLSQKVLKPGDFATLKVTLDTSIKLGPVKKTIKIRSDDPKTPLLKLFLTGNVIPSMAGHGGQKIVVKDPLVLFKGQCATCHVLRGKGKTGWALFQADCAMCHGANGQGGVAMSLLTGNYEDPQHVARIRQVIREGSPRSPEMPPFSQAKGGPLTDAEIDSLVTYLEYQAQQQQGETPSLEEEE